MSVEKMSNTKNTVTVQISIDEIRAFDEMVEADLYELTLKSKEDYMRFQNLENRLIEGRNMHLSIPAPVFFSTSHDQLSSRWLVRNITRQDEKVRLSIYGIGVLSDLMEMNNRRVIDRFKENNREEWAPLNETGYKLAEMSEKLIDELNVALFENKKLKRILEKKNMQ
ncbi:hypothetical protein [Salinicoccus roseus]|uniref:Uncharacterized protein n=1 Tax=Salinicoccus roseus TaxID=45670 RepID=A0A265E5X2_9STAP|nr:hypothetical protein [Salinicoccus roseus]OZT76895.1 hypothetical protein CFN03_07390 [Salinicoccus roseus]